MIKLYRCVGENFVTNANIGYCGDVHSMDRWLEILFPNQNAKEYFENYSNNEICNYILKMKGKRLERVKA